MRTLSATPPAGAQAFARVCEVLETFEFSAQDAVLFVDSIMDMTSDSASGWQRLGTPLRDRTVPKETLRRSWQDAAEVRRNSPRMILRVGPIRVLSLPRQTVSRNSNIENFASSRIKQISL